MLSLASKFAFVVAALALVLGVAVGTDQPVAMVVLVAAAGGAAVAALVLIGAPDHAPPGDTASSPPTSEPARPSRWPVLTAVATLLLATGAASGALTVVAGASALFLALSAWFAQSWSEHPSWTEHHAARVSDRAVMPVLLPVGVFVLVAVVVVSFSRVLLATPKEASTIIALVAALLILGACSLVALRPNFGSSALTTLAIVAGVSVIGAGVVGAASGEREFHHAGSAAHEENEGAHAGEEKEAGGKKGAVKAGAPTVKLVARNVQFDKQSITLHAGTARIEFENAEPLPHNVSLLIGDKPVFTGETFSGPATKTYVVTNLKAGKYEFRCDVHPTTMKGDVVVE